MFAKLEPFSSEDTARYIAHRLQVAGYSGESLFSQGALRIIAEHSQGIPRTDQSLVLQRALAGVRDGPQAGGRRDDGRSYWQTTTWSRCSGLKLLGAVAPAPEAARAVPNSAEPARVPFVSPMLARPPLTSYPAKPKRSVGGWVAGSASVAALVAIVIGILSLSPERIDRFLQVSSDAWNSIRDAAESIRSSATAKSDSGPRVQAAEFPERWVRDSLLPRARMLRSIRSSCSQERRCARSFSEPSESYNGDAIEQIRKLNPAIVDFDHLEAGQVIRFPRVACSLLILQLHSEETSSNWKELRNEPSRMSKNFELLQRVAKDDFFNLPVCRCQCQCRCLRRRPPVRRKRPRRFHSRNLRRTPKLRSWCSDCSRRPARAADQSTCLSRELLATTEAVGSARERREALAEQVNATVCVVDANLCSPQLHVQFGAPNQNGLAEALATKDPIRNFAIPLSRRTIVANLPSGLVKPGFYPPWTDYRERFAELRETFGYILVSGPPLSRETEATFVGQLADGVVLIVEANHTRRETVRRAKEQLESAQVRLLGAVLDQRTFPIPERLYRRL